MSKLGRALRGASWMPLFAALGCGNSHSSSPTRGGPSGAAGSGGGVATSNGPSGSSLVSGGTSMKSSRYSLTGTMGAGIADGTVGNSTNNQLRSGLIGATH